MIILFLPFLKRINILGMALFPFVFLSGRACKDNKILINHEKIHLRQQLELLIVFFYLWYMIEFLYWYFKYRNWNSAYHRISFEREAYQNDQNIDYLKHRNFWAFREYL